ncbi:hypothetical protein Bca101_059770 [Brassica carinata]
MVFTDSALFSTRHTETNLEEQGRLKNKGDCPYMAFRTETGASQSNVVKRLLRFLEAVNLKKGGELIGVDMLLCVIRQFLRSYV